MRSKLLLIITFVILISFSKLIFGQVPNLRSAFGFALFTSSGAFGNVGATNVTGNIGTNAGALTGFPPGTIVGQMHVADSISVQAAADVDVAYNDFSALICDTVIGTTLGNNQVLTAKIYCLEAASIVTGDLILNGEGNSNAVFIFKINGAFSTDILSRVVLIDSASFLNVYWQVNGAVELGDSSIFKGTIVANGAISLLESSSLLGRGLSRLGAISLQNNVVAIEIQSINSLPIELLSFNAKPASGNIQLDWSTESETNNNYFTIQRSKDGINFEEVLRIRGARNSTRLLQYKAIDYHSYAGISYYRLKQTDFNGKFTYSNLVGVDFEKLLDFTIYPNPFSTSTTITINDTTQINNCELRMYSVLGKEVLSTVINKQTTIFETSGLSSGIYFYKISSDNKTIQSGRLISQQ